MKDSKNIIAFIAFLFLMCCSTSTLFADAADGWGLTMGAGGSFKPIDYTNESEFNTSNTYGLGLGYQWAFGKSFSASISATEYGGEGTQSSKADYQYYKMSLMVMELKAWMGSFFVGYHSGIYYLTWIASMDEYSGIEQTPGSGYGLGFETDSGWILAAYREESERFEFAELPDQKTVGNRFVLGYRFR